MAIPVREEQDVDGKIKPFPITCMIDVVSLYICSCILIRIWIELWTLVAYIGTCMIVMRYYDVSFAYF